MAALPPELLPYILNVQAVQESLSGSSNYELEVKFKSYRSDAFSQGVYYKELDRVRSFFESQGYQPTIIESTDFIQGQIRRTIINELEEIWITKSSLITTRDGKNSHIDDRNYNLRYSLSKEEEYYPTEDEVTRFNPTLNRHKMRRSYFLNQDAFRLDLTEVEEHNLIKNISSKSYEVELEVLNWEVIETELMDQVNQILNILHDTENVYTVDEYQTIVNYYNQTFKWGMFDQFTFNHRVLFQSRNLHYRDLKGGGLIGHPTYTYKVTIKADGIRKLLVFHKSGLWLIMPPNDANLVIRLIGTQPDKIRELFGTILEGEFIPMSKRRWEVPGTPTTKYWFWVYDCLAIASQDDVIVPDRIGDVGVQKLRHGLRMSHAEQFVARFRDENELILIELKTFYPENQTYGFRTANDLFETIVRLENLKHTNPYMDDGYIFMPVEMPYDFSVKYTDWQTRKSIWRKVRLRKFEGVTFWKNKTEPWLMYQEGENLQDSGGSFADNEVRWFTKEKIKWIPTSENTWELFQERFWTTIDPVISDPRVRGRRMKEKHGTIIQKGNRLIKTITTEERGSGRISKIPLHLRKLTKYPDICKWKKAVDLTNDFSLQWTKEPPYLILNMSGPDLPGQPGLSSLVPFMGTEQFPFDQNLVDWNNELTRGLPDGSIVEYKWDYPEEPSEFHPQGQQLLIPTRIRDDKNKPNKISFAEDNWNQSQYPIDITTLRGESFKLMSRYHGGIKFNLYDSAYKHLKEIGINAPNILDIGSGQGGDILKWKEAGRVIAVEPNRINLVELRRRIMNIIQQEDVEIIRNLEEARQKVRTAENLAHKVIIINSGGENTILIREVVQLWFGDKADIISLMLSLSFFWQSQELLEKLYQTIIQNLAPHGRGIFFTIDGELVKHTFSPARLETSPTGTMPGDGFSIGNQKHDLDFLELGDATLRYYRSESRLDIDIPDSILRNTASGLEMSPSVTETQTEWLVFLRDLEPGLRLNGWTITNLRRADEEQLLNAAEVRLTRLYTAGEIVPLETTPETPRVTTSSRIPSQRIPRDVSRGSPRRVRSPQIRIPSPRTSPRGETLSSPPRNNPYLPMLPLTYDPSRDIAIGDDAVETIRVTWYNQDPVVRIAVIANGSCFFHAILKAFYPDYANNNSYSHRCNLVKKLRRDLAYLLREEDPNHPGKTYYETAANGSWVDLAGHQLLGLDLGNGVDYRLEGMENLFNSHRDVGNEVYQYVSDMLGINIYITLAQVDDLYPVTNTRRPENSWYPSVIIAGNGSHYEVIGLDLGSRGIQTVFYEDSSLFLNKLQR